MNPLLTNHCGFQNHLLMSTSDHIFIGFQHTNSIIKTHNYGVKLMSLRTFLIFKDRILFWSPSITKSLSNPQTLWCSAPKLSFWILTYKNRFISCPWFSRHQMRFIEANPCPPTPTCYDLIYFTLICFPSGAMTSHRQW